MLGARELQREVEQRRNIAFNRSSPTSLDTAAEFRWAACFGSSETGLPTIGEVPGMARCYAALGYGGNGITFSMLAAQLIQRSISGAGDPDSDLFAFR